MWHKYTTEYYSVIEKNEIMPFVATWMDLEVIMLNKVREIQLSWYHLDMESTVWYKWTSLQNRDILIDIENHKVNKEKKRGGWIGKCGLTDTHYCV